VLEEDVMGVAMNIVAESLFGADVSARLAAKCRSGRLNVAAVA
jgi:hypothetical protein